MRTPINTLVSDDACHISRQIFTSDEVYELEKKYIFGRSWLYLAHESQFKKEGDFITTYMGETPVIVAQGKDGEIHANINSCSHRGLPVCRTESGNAKRFICPYHNWSYTVEGELSAVPQERKVKSPIDKSTLGLPKIPRVESYRGLIFGCLDENVAPLEEHLGDMRFYLDSYFDRFEGGIEVIGAPHKWMLNCNWKLPVENQLGDVGHGPFLHASILDGTPQVDVIEEFGLNVVPEPGHGAALRYMPEDTPIEELMWGMEGISALNPAPGMVEFLRDEHAKIAERQGKAQSRIKGLTYGVYPNLSFLWSNSVLRVSHPKGPGKTEYWSWWVVPKNAPDEVKKALQTNYTFFFGPGGLLEQEDTEAWSQQYSGSNIDYVDHKPYFYGLGAGDETTHPDLPGKVGSCYNEHYAREFYKRWRQEIETGELNSTEEKQ